MFQSSSSCKFRCLLLTAVGLLTVLASKRSRMKTHTSLVLADQMPLSSILPHLESLHEEVKSLLIKNAELRNNILAGLQAQTKAKIKVVQSKASDKPSSIESAANLTSPVTSALKSNSENGGGNSNNNNRTSASLEKQKHKDKPVAVNMKQQVALSLVNNNSSTMDTNKQTALTMKTPTDANQADDPASRSIIDFSELDDFNKWVEINLEYAVKNTQASTEALKEEAQHNNGTVDYSEQAIKDGLEGVKYWQSAIAFQDKTLKNEKFVIMDEIET